MTVDDQVENGRRYAATEWRVGVSVSLRPGVSADCPSSWVFSVAGGKGTGRWQGGVVVAANHAGNE